MAAPVHRESALRVSDCVTELLRKQPFFGSLVLRLPLRPDPTRETLATDGHEIRYSPRWIAETEAHLIETAMARVVMACALKHHTRRGERDPERWQMPCQVRTGDAEPSELSLAENVIRIAMHPADQVVAFSELARTGQSVSAIAARFGASERIVEQRLRLGNAAPELLDAYRADEIGLEVLKAFAVKLALGYDPDSGQEIRFADGTRRVLRIREIAASVPALEARERIKVEMFASAGLGAASGAGLIALFLVAFWYRGAQLGRQKRIRGAEMVTAAELRRRIQAPHLRVLARLPGAARFRPYAIAGIPYPERTETQHTIVSGTTGSGKTVLISDLVSQIRARRTMRPLRQDGDIHAVVLRPGPRRSDEPARRPRAALVAVPGGAQPPRLRHDGRGADPAAEGHGGPVLGHRRAPALLQRRRGAAAEGG